MTSRALRKAIFRSKQRPKKSGRWNKNLGRVSQTHLSTVSDKRLRHGGSGYETTTGVCEGTLPTAMAGERSRAPTSWVTSTPSGDDGDLIFTLIMKK